MDEPLKFLVDDTLRGLTKKLRMLGYDAIERGGASWWTAMALAKKEQRIILTLIDDLRVSPEVTIWVIKSENTNQQVQEVITNIPKDCKIPEPLSRCLVCNVLVTEMPVEEARKLVPPLVAEKQSSFYHCPRCHRIYWQGSHYHKMIAWMKKWIE
jgi:uncharacterized protein with PIN domain